MLAHKHYSAATTTSTISPVCPKCGVTAKSRKISCCGRSGSWFGKCGSAGNVEHEHTWHEGIQACKTLAQFKATIGGQSNAAQQRNSSNGPDITAATNTITYVVKDEANTTDWTPQGVYYDCDVSVTTQYSRRT